MPRTIPHHAKIRALDLMTEGVSQRCIAKETGLSRPYLRKLAKDFGFQFPRNGIEVIGNTCMCTNCSVLFRRSPSKIARAKIQFCSDECRFAWTKGINHPAWKEGQSSKTFSQWVKNQSQYKEWRENVLARDGNKCVISGKTEELEAHHIMHKAEEEHPEKVFDINNGVTMCKEVHIAIHKLTRTGMSFEESCEFLINKYKDEK